MVHIDVGAILQESVNGVYTDLVTRATGRTVRTRIETHIGDGMDAAVVVIDFSRVGFIDLSCADEVVAALMRQCCEQSPGFASFLLFTGMNDDHLDAVEWVLERQKLALVVRIARGGAFKLVGMVDPTERSVWEAVVRRQPATVADIAREASLPEDETASRLASLHRRRLIVRDGAAYRAPTGSVA